MKNIKKLSGIIAIIVFFIVISISTNRSHEKFCENFLKSKFSGKIIKKYINHQEHLYKTLVYLKVTVKDSMTFNTDQSDFYSFVDVGDSIIKIEHSNEIRIANKDTSFLINFNCY